MVLNINTTQNYMKYFVVIVANKFNTISLEEILQCFLSTLVKLAETGGEHMFSLYLSVQGSQVCDVSYRYEDFQKSWLKVFCIL